MAEMQRPSPVRPIAPHLQIYKPQISTVLSILHRISGAALGIGTLLFAWWLVAAASGPAAYGHFEAFISSIIGRIILLGFTFALFFHLCNGIRHLGWDTVSGMDLPTMHRTGWLVVVASIVLTIAVWLLGYWVRG